MVSHWLSVCRTSVCHLSVRPYFHSQTINWVDVNGFSPNLVYALILWKSGSGLLMSKYRPFLPAMRLYFHFRMITLLSINGFSPNLVCASILRRSGLGLLKGKYCKFSTELSARDTSIFSFLDNNFKKYQWIFTKLSVCIGRAPENRKIAILDWKKRILDRFQTPQNANNSVQQVCALNPIFHQPTNFMNQWCLKNHKRSSMPKLTTSAHLLNAILW